MNVPLRGGDARMAGDSRQSEHFAPRFTQAREGCVSQAIRLERGDPGDLQGFLVPLLCARFLDVAGD